MRGEGGCIDPDSGPWRTFGASGGSSIASSGPPNSAFCTGPQTASCSLQGQPQALLCRSHPGHGALFVLSCKGGRIHQQEQQGAGGPTGINHGKGVEGGSSSLASQVGPQR